MLVPILSPFLSDHSSIMKEQYFALTDAFSDPCVVVGHKDGLIVYSNESFRELLSATTKQINGQILEDVVHPIHSDTSHLVWHSQFGEFRIKEVGITVDDTLYRQIIFLKKEPVISPAVIDTARKMAEVLLHRLRSPLTGTAGLVEMLELDMSEGDGLELVHTIKDGLTQMNELLEELDAFSSTREQQSSHVDIQYLINDLMGDFPPAERRRVHLAVQTDHLGLHTDYSLLRFMIRELIANALQHSNEEIDSVRLSYTGKPHPIFQITNYGEVIPSSDVERLPQPFFTTKARHLGLGLSKAYLIADQLKARIRLINNSQINGITFEVQF